VSAKSIGRQNMVILVILLATQLFLMSGSVRGAKGAATVERWLMRLTSPVVAVAEAVGGTVGGTAGTLREMLTARARTHVLEANVRRLSSELGSFREAERENVRLRLLLGMKDTLVPESVAASIVTSNVSGQSRMIVVDRGSSDGVQADQAVVTWGGAVGRVVATSGGHAKVRLLTDPSSGVAGVLQRSRAQGIVFGTADPGLELRFVPRFSDVAHGDRVVTSGLAGIFPRGFGVGRVVSIRQAADGTQTIELDPELDFAALEEVLIVLETPEDDSPQPLAAEIEP
jgi:rod shape-determining protein MreC